MKPFADTKLRSFAQKDAYTSPWPLRVRLGVALWECVRLCFFRTTPKPLNSWRLFLLKLFGARVHGRPFVSGSAAIKMPWNLTLEDRACLAPRSEVYNLGPVILRERSTLAQEAYLCAGTHDLSRATLPLVVGPIDVGADVFIGARAFVLPGVTLGEGAVVGACAVVSRDVDAWHVVAGNPAKVIGLRQLDRHS